jgi:hypothetical protein
MKQILILSVLVVVSIVLLTGSLSDIRAFATGNGHQNGIKDPNNPRCEYIDNGNGKYEHTCIASDVTIHTPPSLGNDPNYHYSDGLKISYSNIGGLGFNGKTFDITKYGAGIPQQPLRIGQSANYTFKIYDERGPSTVSHVGLYMNFKGDAVVTNSDTSIVWDKQTGIKVTDPKKFFSTASASMHHDSNFAYLSIKVTPAKTIPDSSMLMRMWDDQFTSMDLSIHG